jgi:hypothetical protein
MSMILSKAPNWEPQKKATPPPRERKNSARGAAESADADADSGADADAGEQPSVATEQVAPEVMATPDTVGQPGANTTLGMESVEDSTATEQ